jgi:hypothetical protein
MPEKYPEMLNPADWPLSRLTAMEPQELLDFSQRAIAEYQIVKVLEGEEEKEKEAESGPPPGMVEFSLPASVAPQLEQVRALLAKQFGREFSMSEAFIHLIKNSKFADPNYKSPEKKKPPSKKKPRKRS